MLIVDLHALESINLLHLADDKVGKWLKTSELKHIARGQWALHDNVALLHSLTVKHNDRSIFRDRHLMNGAVFAGNFKANLGLHFFTE